MTKTLPLLPKDAAVAPTYPGDEPSVVVSAQSGFIVAGHGRLEAANLLDVQSVPVDRQEFATEADELAHLLADNRIAELADLDSALVACLLKDLREEGFDIELGGFTDDQFTDLAERLAAAAGGDADAEPQIDRADELNRTLTGFSTTSRGDRTGTSTTSRSTWRAWLIIRFYERDGHHGNRGSTQLRGLRQPGPLPERDLRVAEERRSIRPTRTRGGEGVQWKAAGGCAHGSGPRLSRGTRLEPRSRSSKGDTQNPGGQLAIVLDADVIIRGERGTFDLPAWVAGQPGEEFAVAAITVAELWHGVERATGVRRAKRQSYPQQFFSAVPVLPYTARTAFEHARLWAALEEKGAMIGFYDVMVAATALERNWPVASFNVRHFRTVDGLKVIEPGSEGPT